MASRAKITNLFGSAGCLGFVAYLWCILYVPVAIIMAPKFKYFSNEPTPIVASIPVGEPRTLTAPYTYEAKNEQGEMKEITVPRGTVVYPLYRFAAGWGIKVRDQRGNEFLLSEPEKFINIVNEKVLLHFPRVSRDKETGELFLQFWSEKNINDMSRNVYAFDFKIWKSEVEGKDVIVSHIKTVRRNNENHSYMGLSIDGKFIGYTNYVNLEFVRALPAMEVSSNPIPMTARELPELAVGKSLGEFYQRYRYPTSVTVAGNKVVAEIPEVYSGRMKSDDRRWGGLLLIAEKAAGAEVESAIITDFGFSEKLRRRVHPLDFVPYGGAWLDNAASLRRFIRGIERQEFFREKKYGFEIDLTAWGEKAIHFVLPKSWHDGFIERALNFIFMLLSLVFMCFAGVPLVVIPYLIVAGATMSFKKFSNLSINIMGGAVGLSVLLTGVFLFAITETPFVALLAVMVGLGLGVLTYFAFSKALSWGRCDDCISWGTYEFTQYLWEGNPYSKTESRETWTETTHSDGRKTTSDHKTYSNTTYYREVTKEYECSECDATREVDERETLSRQRAEELAG